MGGTERSEGDVYGKLRMLGSFTCDASSLEEVKLDLQAYESWGLTYKSCSENNGSCRVLISYPSNIRGQVNRQLRARRRYLGDVGEISLVFIPR